MKKFLVLFSLFTMVAEAQAAVEKTACFKEALKAYKKVANNNAFEIRKPFELKEGQDLLDFYGHVIMTVNEEVIVYPVHSSFHSGYQIESIVLAKNNCALISISSNYSE